MSRMSQVLGASAILWLLPVGVLPGVAFAADEAKHDHAHTSEPVASSSPDNAAVANVMQQMQAMHAAMAAAKTPADRQALMADHMKTMQAGMQMMQQMGAQSGKDAMPSQMMQMRMNMMTMMMQMMMDRQQMGGMSMGGGAMGGMAPPNAPAKPGK